MKRKEFAGYKRIVIKIGSSVINDSNGVFSRKKVNDICKQALSLIRKGKEIVLVSSGAISCGMDLLGLKKRPKDLPTLQACAAIGQGKLMKAYEDYFSKDNIHTAQVLLTRDGFEDRERYLNARNTLTGLLRLKTVPIVNENDTVATDEIKFGDNDRLSALVSNLINADLLILLSDVKGFYLKDGTRVSVIGSREDIDKKFREHLIKGKREQTVGGMETKLEAASMMMTSGISTVIADGSEADILEKIFKGEDVGTLFIPKDKKQAARKSWLAYSTAVKGKVKVDEGAYRALSKGGKSLLATGIVSAEGKFKVGDIVDLTNPESKGFARGLVNYSSEEINKIKGKKTDEIEGILGYKYYDEVIHRDNLVILE